MTTTETKTTRYTVATFEFDGKTYEVCYKPFVRAYETLQGIEIDGAYWWLRCEGENASCCYDSFSDFIENAALAAFGIDMDDAYFNDAQDFYYAADFKDCIYKSLCF